ncbi:hypothetical protein K2Y11_22460 [bacterium]|nr:hypothetical protein [bacterium]
MPKATFDPDKCPAIQFCLLESAIRREDYRRAQELTRKLRRLGVDVKFRRSRELQGASI